MKSMEQMQQEVDDYISQFKTGYFSPLANLARMTEEVGELAREINHHFGEKKRKILKKIIQLKLNWETIYLFYCVLQTL
ncbi:MazG family protein [Staphylococcus epidermidis NIHLM053]|nr:MazG family protein [Staphylococcus epidermidis NIHLM053]